VLKHLHLLKLPSLHGLERAGLRMLRSLEVGSISMSSLQPLELCDLSSLTKLRLSSVSQLTSLHGLGAVPALAVLELERCFDLVTLTPLRRAAACTDELEGFALSPTRYRMRARGHPCGRRCERCVSGSRNGWALQCGLSVTNRLYV